MLNPFRRKQAAAKRTAIVCTQSGCTMATVSTGPAGRPAVDVCVSFTGGAAEQRAALSSWLGQDRGDGSAISCVLDPDDYQMLLVEAPDVLPAEIKAAVRWRLKDLIDYPVADAVIDVFPIPEPARRSSAKMMYAIAARRHAIEQQVAVMRGASAALDVIDIPELALRNVAAKLPEAAQGLIFLWVNDDSAQLFVIKGEMIYLSRQVSFPAEGFAAPDSTDGHVEAVSLELQRSMDYFESHYEQAPIAHLVIAPGDERARRLQAALADQTSLDIQTLDLRRAVDTADASWSADRRSVLAIGAAMRQTPRRA
ncbi:MAG: hypothetical protein KGL92_14580 [Gammaproteobacteria bacterium]|nr:hypothetical protein [Gammaproteobacteria bacterium]